MRNCLLGPTAIFTWALVCGRLVHGQAPSPMRLGMTLQIDGGAFAPDAAIKDLVGHVPTLGEIRELRPTIGGAFDQAVDWSYFIAVDARGLYRDNARPSVRLNQLSISAMVAGLGKVTLGKQREGVSREMLESRNNASLMERPPSLTAFLPARNDGLRIEGADTARRMTWSIGYYNSFLESHRSASENGSQIAGRVTAAPWTQPSMHRLLQVGTSVRWSRATGDSMRFDSRPQANTAPNFLDTGRFPASGSLLVGYEALLMSGPIQLASEGTVLRVATPGPPLTFHGHCLSMTWFPRGEHNVYDATTGTLAGVDAGTHRNTFDLTADIGTTSLASENIDGGTLQRATLGTSWRRQPGLRFQIDGGWARLQREGIHGWMPLVLTRIQWTAP